MDLLLEIVIIILLFQLIFVIYNLMQFPVFGSIKLPVNPSEVKISVLIPARNEAKRIGECLQSLANQSELPEEVLILDDRSEDDTKEIVENWSERHSFIKLLNGKPLKNGWMGKSFACHQLAKRAGSEWFLFIDADVRLSPDAIKTAKAAAHELESGMISGFPHQLVSGWMEKLVVPMMMFTIVCHLPIAFIAKSKDPKFAAAYGGFILIDQKTYREAGGHEAIRQSLVDDMDMAKAVKRKGLKFRLAKIDGISAVKMYDSAKEVWKGYRKNIYPGVNRNTFILAGVFTLYMLLYLLPAVYMIISIFISPLLFGLSAAGYMLGALIKGFIDKSNGLPAAYGWLVPLSVLSLIMIGADSIRVSKRRLGYEWKGRRYM